MTQLLNLIEKMCEQFQSTEVHCKSLAQMLNAPEGPDSFIIELGVNETMLLILHDCLRGDAGDPGKDLQGITILLRGVVHFRHWV